MAYQVLARKWRPRTFKGMVGQEHVLKALINALEHQRLHHAYLFTGTRGVGKTTIARILAKCLNCETGVSSEPCDQCGACVSINQGNFVDLIEVDAASRTKVEDTRDLLNNVQYAPANGRYKVYLIDEVHMLSNSSFNALLKTLEEPPPHVKFLLATTDPQKLPATVLSRCLQFNLKHINPEQIVTYLKTALTDEDITCEETALWQLARAANGSMRDALSLTDQAIAYGGGKITEEECNAMLGTIDHAVIYDLLAALSEDDGHRLLSTVAKLAEYSSDFGSVLAELLIVLHRIAVAQALPDAIDNSLGDQKRILGYAQNLSAEDVQLFYQIALIGKKDLPLAPDPRGGLEMVLLRMLAFKLQTVNDLSPVEPVKSNVSHDDIKNTNITATKKKTDFLAKHEPLTQPKDSADSKKEVKIPKEEKITPIELTSSKVKIPLAQFTPDNWLQVYFSLTVEGILQTTAANCIFKVREGKTLAFALDDRHSALYDDNHQHRLATLLSDYFGENLHVRIDIEKIGVNIETPSTYIANRQQQRLEQAEYAIANDELVKQLIKQFDAEIVENSIIPIE